MLEIRRARPSDAERIWEIRTQAIRAGCPTHYSPQEVEQWATVRMHAAFPRVIENTDFFLMISSDVVVAFGFLDKEKAEVAGMFVHPGFQGRGLGRKILETLESVAREADLPALTLTASLNAEKFYTALGFTPVERTKWNHPDGFELPCVNMRKVLMGNNILSKRNDE